MYSHSENNKILESWQELSINNGDGKIEFDGVAYKGDIHTFLSEDGKICNERQPGNEESIWNNSDKRILFVAKEPNDPENPYDARAVMAYDPENGIEPTHIFLKSMLFITKGLMESSSDNSAEFKRDEPMANLMETWDKTAVAKINVKKQPGGSVADMAQVNSSMQEYRDLLRKQLQLLDANIVVCCDNKAGILSTIKDLVYPNAVQVNDEVWHDEQSNTLLIESYRLSALILSYEVIYNRVIYNYVDALEKIKIKIEKVTR
ncbi:MAG: hypothetical protein K2M53_11245 [Muribaculaceae bacterium]|nr:hypothetical protein [Muribaculaceae bacterium]